MLFLLRNIRRKLLTNNKVTTYLLYAIGEIFLVVIGILIAFQVDAYKGQLQNEGLQKLYTQTLIGDLKKDIVEYEKILNLTNRLIQQLDSANLLISAPNTTTEEVIEFAKNQYDIAIAGYWGTESQTLKSIINTGKFEIYPLDIRNKIMEVNKINQETILFSSDIVDWSLNSLRDYENRYLRGKLSNLMKPNDQLIEAAWADIDQRAFLSAFINLINTKYVNMSVQKGLLERQVKTTTELIQLLEEYP